MRARGRRPTAQILFAVLAASLLGSSWSAPAQPYPPRVLYLTQSAAFAHAVLPHSETVLTRLGEETERFSVTVARDAVTLTTETLGAYDAVVFYTTGELPMSTAQKSALLRYVRDGGGFVGIHSATDTLYEWAEYGALIGGYFDGHPWRQEVGIRVEDPTHPATRHLGESFRIDDEIYQFRDWSRSDVDVLLSLDVSSVDLTVPGIRRADRDFALAWTRREGSGRVFYTALGHRAEVWSDERFQRHLVEGIIWSIGDDRTSAPRANTLTAEEATAGWQLLFDGTDLAAWRGYGRSTAPEGWRAVDGTLARVGRAGDLVTIEQFDDFELLFDWRVDAGGNSGVMYRVVETDRPAWHTGPEFQILDNDGHRDGEAAITSAGSNYAITPPVRDVTHPLGEWNRSRILVSGRHVEHWMNGVQLLAYEIDSPEWNRRVAASKFAEMPRYGREPRGHIVIQDHGDPVALRNLKVRRLAAP